MIRLRTLLIIIILSGNTFSVAQQTFQNVTTSMGITGQTGLGHAVGWGDIDNDGDPDLGISNQEGGGFWFYLNEGDHFTNITASAGLSGLGGNKIIIAEMTGDEFNDLVLRTRSGTQHLFESNGDGTFNDITSISGIASAAVYGIADFNNDGATDLISVAGDYISILYNNGDASFAPAEIIAPMPDFWGVATLDYDRDGLMDIYWTTYGNNPNILLMNNGDGTFTDVTIAAGVSYTQGGHALDVADFNNDGMIDIYVGSYSNLNCSLFRNNGDGTFSDIASSAGAAGHHDTRTSTFIDYNNDGWLDIFSSHHDFYSYSNTMLRNNGNETFTGVAPSLGISGEWIGDYFGVGWADYNLDGATDFFAAGHIDKYRLFKNNNCPGNFLSVYLKGVESNPNGIGAQVDVWCMGQVISRNMLSDGGFHDFSDLHLNFGLDDALVVDSIIVYWPSGIVQKIGITNANHFITIIEDETTQTIPLNSGFAFVSSRIMFEEADMLEVLQNNLNDNLDFVRNSQGQTLRKIGPNWVNGIGDWITTEGYLFKMNATDQLTFDGDFIDPLTVINLFEGYQFVSYLPAIAIDALIAFENILNNNLIYIRNSNGEVLRKIGPNWVNGIGNANPGEGYLIKMFTDDELVYNIQIENVKNSTPEKQLSHFIFKGGNAAVSVYTIYVSGLDIGDEIAVFDNEKMVGASVINSENVLENSVPVFSTLNDGQGYKAGNIISIKVFYSETKEEVTVSFETENPYGDAYIENYFPVEDGEYSILRITKNISELKGVSDIISIYPNPAKDIINIVSDEIIKKIEILNLSGQSLITSVENSQKICIKVERYSPGIYFIKIRTQKSIITKKFSIKK